MEAVPIQWELQGLPQVCRSLQMTFAPMMVWTPWNLVPTASPAPRRHGPGDLGANQPVLDCAAQVVPLSQRPGPPPPLLHQTHLSPGRWPVDPPPRPHQTHVSPFWQVFRQETVEYPVAGALTGLEVDREGLELDLAIVDPELVSVML